MNEDILQKFDSLPDTKTLEDFLKKETNEQENGEMK